MATVSTARPIASAEPEETASIPRREVSHPARRTLEGSRSGLVEAVTGWSNAWSEQRAEDYLGYYSRNFEPSGRIDRATWAQQRERRLLQPGFIEVAVAILDVEMQAPERAKVRFLQRYRSDGYRDVVTKTLDLVLEEEDWKILREIVEEEQ